MIQMIHNLGESLRSLGALFRAIVMVFILVGLASALGGFLGAVATRLIFPR